MDFLNENELSQFGEATEVEKLRIVNSLANKILENKLKVDEDVYKWPIKNCDNQEHRYLDQRKEETDGCSSSSQQNRRLEDTRIGNCNTEVGEPTLFPASSSGKWDLSREPTFVGQHLKRTNQLIMEAEQLLSSSYQVVQSTDELLNKGSCSKTGMTTHRPQDCNLNLSLDLSDFKTSAFTPSQVGSECLEMRTHRAEVESPKVIDMFEPLERLKVDLRQSFDSALNDSTSEQLMEDCPNIPDRLEIVESFRNEHSLDKFFSESRINFESRLAALEREVENKLAQVEKQEEAAKRRTSSHEHDEQVNHQVEDYQHNLDILKLVCRDDSGENSQFDAVPPLQLASVVGGEFDDDDRTTLIEYPLLTRLPTSFREKKTLPETTLGPPEQSCPIELTYAKPRWLYSTHKPVDFTQWLPNELWLMVFGFLSREDLCHCATVSRRFCDLTSDPAFWRSIVLSDRRLTDSTMRSLGARQPRHVKFKQCDAQKVSNEGLRSFFRATKHSMEELSVLKCSGKGLVGDNLFLHASCHSLALHSITVPWCHVTGDGLCALLDAIPALRHLDISGNTLVGDAAFVTLCERHSSTLRSLVMEGCFNVSPEVVVRLCQSAPLLDTLNIALCGKIGTQQANQILASLSNIISLDVHALKSVGDSSIRALAANSPKLRQLVIGSCNQVSDAAITCLKNHRITKLDVSNCVRLTDASLLQLDLAPLEWLDVSGCSAVTSALVEQFAATSMSKLRALRLSYCREVTQKSLESLVRSVPSLESLHLYGCKQARMSVLNKINRRLVIEK